MTLITKRLQIIGIKAAGAIGLRANLPYRRRLPFRNAKAAKLVVTTPDRRVINQYMDVRKNAQLEVTGNGTHASMDYRPVAVFTQPRDHGGDIKKV